MEAKKKRYAHKTKTAVRRAVFEVWLRGVRYEVNENRLCRADYNVLKELRERYWEMIKVLGGDYTVYKVIKSAFPPPDDDENQTSDIWETDSARNHLRRTTRNTSGQMEVNFP